MADKIAVAVAVIVLVVIGIGLFFVLTDYELPTGGGGGGFWGGPSSTPTQQGGGFNFMWIIAVIVIIALLAGISKIKFGTADFTREPRRRWGGWGGSVEKKVRVELTVPDNIVKGEPNNFPYVFHNKSRKNLSNCRILVDTRAFIDRTGNCVGTREIVFPVSDVGKRDRKPGTIAIRVNKNVSDGLYNIKTQPVFDVV